MEDNKSLTQEELNLYYYEKIIEKTYLFTRKCDRWTDLDYESLDIPQWLCHLTTANT